MRVLYLCADRGIASGGSKGASAHLRNLGAALVRRGHDVLLACRRTDGGNPLDPGIELRRLPSEEAEHADWLEGAIRDWGAEVVLERYSLSSGPAGVACRATGLPLVLEVNAPLVDEAARHRGLADVDAWREWEREVLGAADALVAVSRAVAEHAIASGVASDRVVVVPNGVDLERFRGVSGEAVRTRLGLGSAPVVGFCGSLKPWHGVDDLVVAAARLPAEVRLLVVGDGPERQALEALAAGLGLAGRAVFTGAVPEAAVSEHLAAFDVAVAPYAPMTGFYFSPLKVVEYLAAGRAAVASAQGELLDLGDALVTVPAGDVAALTAALRRLLTDAEARRLLELRAAAAASTRSWLGVVERLEPILGAAGVRV